MAGISDKALKSQYIENKYRFNSGNELQNQEFSDGSRLETYDASHRMYDPQIGRFQQPDPWSKLSPESSQYSFVDNNHLLFNDPLGLKKSTGWKELPPVVVTPSLNTEGGQVLPPLHGWLSRTFSTRYWGGQNKYGVRYTVDADGYLSGIALRELVFPDYGVANTEGVNPAKLAKQILNLKNFFIREEMGDL